MVTPAFFNTAIKELFMDTREAQQFYNTLTKYISSDLANELLIIINKHTLEDTEVAAIEKAMEEIYHSGLEKGYAKAVEQKN